MTSLTKFLVFSRDTLKVVGGWLVPFTFAVYVAFELYNRFKELLGFQDYMLGWAVIVLAIMKWFGDLGLGRQMQAVYERHFGPENTAEPA